MTVRVNKPTFNLREKLSELERPIGLKGSELMSAATVQDARDLVSAGRKNIVINGDMRVNQRRDLATTASGIYPVDRFKIDHFSGTNTTEQYALSSTDGPSTEKFNYALRCTSGGNLTAVNSYVQVTYKIEHKDIFNSGWNYTSSGSTNNNLTVSFWVRSSIDSDVNWMFLTHKATAQVFRPEATKLTAGVWKKVIAKIPPNSSINFDDTTDLGASIYLFPHLGSNFTSTPTNLNGWEAWSGSKYGITNSTWGGSSGATFDLTGVQIEVSDNPTEFERRTIGEEIALCQRYYWQPIIAKNTALGIPDPAATWGVMGISYGANSYYLPVQFPTQMRVPPTQGGDGMWRSRTSNINAFTVSSFGLHGAGSVHGSILGVTGGSIAASTPFWFEAHSEDANLFFNAEF